MVDDAISRRALREEMYHQAFETDSNMQRWDGGCWIRYKMFENAIESAPPIDTVKHGKWIVKEWVMECSFCGWITEYYGGLEEEWNYCPQCGARMDQNIEEERHDKNRRI